MKIKITKQDVLQEAKDYVFILIGLFLYTFGISAFVSPNEFTTGGVPGIGLLIHYATDIPLWVPYFIINSALLVFAVRIFGFKFSIRTIVNVVLITIMFKFLPLLITEPIVKSEPFMNAILGGIFCGVGLGLVINHKGSTGGTDIIVLIINHFKSNVSVGKGYLICDVLIISSSWFIFHDLEKIVYGLVVMSITSYVVDLVLDGAKQSVQFFIFSEKYDEIADEINQKLNRGCTILNATGWYTKKDQKVIMLMTRKSESVIVFRLIKSIDPKAFISQGTVRGVYGEGFEQIRG
jgi:Uncharacterized conserved protein